MRRMVACVGLLAVGVAALGYGRPDSEAAGAAYTVAFTSFAPLDSDLFLAEADGSGARPLVPHAGLDENASFSSDGRWVVFTSERNGSADVYRVHPDGSELTRLTDDPAYDDQGALSPDGRWLAFVSSRSGQAEIWTLELETKSLRRLTDHPAGDFRPSWSPDGKWLAFSSDRDSTRPKDRAGFGTLHSTEIYVARSDGSALRRVTSGRAFAGSPSWSPDGTKLVFYEAALSEVDLIKSPLSPRATTQIVSVDVRTGERQALTAGAGEKWSPQWLPGGGIGYASGGPDGGIEHVFAPAGARGEFGRPSWSADGRRLVFHRDVETAWPPVKKWHSRDPQFSLLRTGVFPSYSPSTGRLLCNSARAGILHNDILVMDLSGGARSTLFHDPIKSALAPVWSPDADHVAFALGGFFQSRLGPAVADIATMRRDGTGLKVLTNGSGNFAFPSWSPNGREIVFRAAGGNDNGLRIVTVDTGATRVLTSGQSHDNFPNWSRARDLIAFTSYREGDYDIYTIKPDGSDLRRLTNTPGNDAHCAWSPDGQWIAFACAGGGFKDETALHPRNPQPYGEICVMRADGSDVRMLTDNAYEEGTPGWVPTVR